MAPVFVEREPAPSVRGSRCKPLLVVAEPIAQLLVLVAARVVAEPIAQLLVQRPAGVVAEPISQLLVQRPAGVIAEPISQLLGTASAVPELFGSAQRPVVRRWGPLVRRWPPPLIV